MMRGAVASRGNRSYRDGVYGNWRGVVEGVGTMRDLTRLRGGMPAHDRCDSLSEQTLEQVTPSVVTLPGGIMRCPQTVQFT